MKKIIITALCLLLFVQTATAINCYYDKNPYIYLNTRPVALCMPESNASEHCLTWLSNPENSSEEWGVMPKSSYIVSYGPYHYYEVIGGVASVGFSKEGLYHNTTVTGNVLCGTEQTSFNFTPLFFDYDEITEATFWTAKNIIAITAGITILIFIFTLAFLFIPK